MRRRGRVTFGEYRAPRKSELYNDFLSGWWVSRKLFLTGPYSEYLKESKINTYYYKLGELYLKNLSTAIYSIELLSFSSAVYLVNTGNLIVGIIIGVIGILLVNRISETKTNLDAIFLSTKQLEHFDEMKRRDKRFRR